MASDNFKSSESKLKESLVSLTRSANRLANEDLSFQRSVHPDVATRLDDAGERLVNLASGLLKSAAQSGNVRIPRLDEPDDIDLRWRGIVDVIDHLLEKADTTLDEYTGLIKRQETQAHDAVREARAAPDIACRMLTLTVSANNKVSRQQHQPAQRSGILSHNLRNANITKPQLLFEKKPDNYAAPWRPILTAKPHAQVPLDQSIQLFQPEGETATARYRNPYQHEICDMKYPESMYQTKEPVPYLPPEATAPIWVDTFDGVVAMLEELKQAKEIAIDLEHHEYRSYIGLTSLMQVSTRSKDWIVDTLKPWRHRLEVLNEVFADPKIVKVFHGSYMDMIWLQRDLGLYVVGLFDTSAACEVLHFPGRSLAYLLKKFIDFDADKKYQLADWRIRPLPEEMLYYARSDTHYLLYIFDRLRNQLVEASGFSKPQGDRIASVLQKSKEYASKSYEGTSYGEDGKGPMGWYRPLSKKPPARYTDTQFAVYRAVHKWRDDLARREDESPGYIMPIHAVYDTSRHIPTDLRALISILGHNSRGAKPRIQELLSVVQQAASDPNPMSFQATFFTAFTGKDHQPPLAPSAEKQHAEEAAIQRSLRSQMFGDVPVSSRWDSSSQPITNAMDTVRFPVPWARFVAGFTAEETLTAPPLAEVPEAGGPAPSAPTNGSASEEYTVSLNASKKRKASELAEKAGANAEEESDTSSSSESDSEPDPEPEPKPDARSSAKVEPEPELTLDIDTASEEPEKTSQQKKKGKKKKKQSKKGKDAAEAGVDLPQVGGTATQPAKKSKKQKKKDKKKKANSAKTDLDAEEEPFDYSTARSMIHRQDTNNGGKEKVKKKVKDNNLFNKDLEGDIKPARKTNFERSGKSKTFSS